MREMAVKVMISGNFGCKKPGIMDFVVLTGVKKSSRRADPWTPGRIKIALQETGIEL